MNSFTQVEAILILLIRVSKKRTFNEVIFLKKTQINYIRKCLQLSYTYETPYCKQPSTSSSITTTAALHWLHQARPTVHCRSVYTRLNKLLLEV